MLLVIEGMQRRIFHVLGMLKHRSVIGSSVVDVVDVAGKALVMCNVVANMLCVLPQWGNRSHNCCLLTLL